MLEEEVLPSLEEGEGVLSLVGAGVRSGVGVVVDVVVIFCMVQTEKLAFHIQAPVQESRSAMYSQVVWQPPSDVHMQPS